MAEPEQIPWAPPPVTIEHTDFDPFEDTIPLPIYRPERLS